MLFEDKTIDNTCTQKCSGQNLPYCNRVCFLREVEVYGSDKKIKMENFKNLFMASPSSGRGNIGEKWNGILEDSVKICSAEHEVPEEVEEKAVSMIVFNMINCVRRHNFVACPDLVDKQECKDMREAIRTCTKDSEEMLFGVFHEERKEDMKKGGTALNKGSGGGLGR